MTIFRFFEITVVCRLGFVVREEYLAVFMVVQNLVGIDTVI